MPYQMSERKLKYNIKLIIAEQSKRWLSQKAWNKYYQNVQVFHAKGGSMSW
jgi:hypothetical protein